MFHLHKGSQFSGKKLLNQLFGHLSHVHNFDCTKQIVLLEVFSLVDLGHEYYGHSHFVSQSMTCTYHSKGTRSQFVHQLIAFLGKDGSSFIIDVCKLVRLWTGCRHVEI